MESTRILLDVIRQSILNHSSMDLGNLSYLMVHEEVESQRHDIPLFRAVKKKFDADGMSESRKTFKYLEEDFLHDVNLLLDIAEEMAQTGEMLGASPDFTKDQTTKGLVSVLKSYISFQMKETNVSRIFTTPLRKRIYGSECNFFRDRQLTDKCPDGELLEYLLSDDFPNTWEEDAVYPVLSLALVFIGLVIDHIKEPEDLLYVCGVLFQCPKELEQFVYEIWMKSFCNRQVNEFFCNP